MKNGKVTLVGAGPGDPELLTIKAAKAIAAASLILVDDLVSDAVTALASDGARIVHVGKRGGCKSTPQSFILKMMVNAARAGESVVRLKGGDPFVFGRGGEELEYLRAAGVEASVINGITAGLAAATSIGVPLTHRASAQGVVFVTGHTQPGGAATDWRALAQTANNARLTLVIYMGVRNAALLQAELLHGLPATTPLAIVQDASLPTQRHVVTRLADMAQAIADHAIRSPAIMVVGDVSQAASLAGACLPAAPVQSMPRRRRAPT